MKVVGIVCAAPLVIPLRRCGIDHFALADAKSSSAALERSLAVPR